MSLCFCRYSLNAKFFTHFLCVTNAFVYIAYTCDLCVARLSVVSQSFKIYISYLVFLCVLRCLLTFCWFVKDHANVGYLNDRCLYSVQRCCTSFCRGSSSLQRHTCAERFLVRRWRSSLPSPPCLLVQLRVSGILQYSTAAYHMEISVDLGGCCRGAAHPEAVPT